MWQEQMGIRVCLCPQRSSWEMLPKWTNLASYVAKNFVKHDKSQFSKIVTFLFSRILLCLIQAFFYSFWKVICVGLKLSISIIQSCTTGRKREREADGFSSEHLYDDLLCMCALVQLGRRFATCPALLLAVAIFMNPLDARGMGTGALLWSLLLRH